MRPTKQEKKMNQAFQSFIVNNMKISLTFFIFEKNVPNWSTRIRIDSSRWLVQDHSSMVFRRIRQCRKTRILKQHTWNFRWMLLRLKAFFSFLRIGAARYRLFCETVLNPQSSYQFLSVIQAALLFSDSRKTVNVLPLLAYVQVLEVGASVLEIAYYVNQI